jgi:hypothetical protein
MSYVLCSKVSPTKSTLNDDYVTDPCTITEIFCNGITLSTVKMPTIRILFPLPMA